MLAYGEKGDVMRRMGDSPLLSDLMEKGERARDLKCYANGRRRGWVEACLTIIVVLLGLMVLGRVDRRGDLTGLSVQVVGKANYQATQLFALMIRRGAEPALNGNSKGAVKIIPTDEYIKVFEPSGALWHQSSPGEPPQEILGYISDAADLYLRDLNQAPPVVL